jgi:hypothetical protein
VYPPLPKEIIERPFYERYPSQFKEKDGEQTFTEDPLISMNHDKYLPETYFPIVAQIRKHPRYTNKRAMDPHVKCYLDNNNLNEPISWGLPVPNEVAAYKSLAKYAKDLLPMTRKQVQAMNLAWFWTEIHFSPYMLNSRIRTREEVVAKLDMTTSSGAPFNLLYPTKRELFEQWTEAGKWLDEDWETLATDPNWTCLCTNALKEEMRTAEKIMDNSIRTFTAMAVDMTVHGNRLFADMNEKMNDSYLKSSSGVGMSPYKGNWDKLYRKLNVFKKGYALDESQYDSSIRSYMMWGCAQFRWKMLRAEDQTHANLQRLKTIYRNLINTLIISPEGVLIFKLAGNPSGSPNTINDNTLVLYTLLAYAWIMNYDELVQENEEDVLKDQSYENFEEHTSKVLVGDDNTWTVSDVAHEFYNAITVINQWNRIGVTTTTDSMEPRRAQDLDFLSAHTVFIADQAVPVYSREKLLSTLLYAPKLHHTPAVTLQRAAALLQVGWTDLVFRRFCRDLIKWLMEEFEDTCYDDPEWKMAKTGILSDHRIRELYLGKTVQLLPQGISRNARKIIKLDKITMSVIVQQVRPKKKGGANRRRRPARGRRGQAIRNNNNNNVLVPVRSKGKGPAPRGRRRIRRPRAPGFGNQRMLTGFGSTRNQTVNKRGMTVTEDEFIAAVTVANQPNFNAVQYPVNIGQAGTFPWGSTLAKNFEKYEFEFLEFYYKREVSEFATNGQVGKVILSFDSDASDGPPANKQTVEDSDPHVDGMPSENISLVIPPRMLKRLNDAHYVRIAGLPGATDIKTYDVGNFYVSTQGILNAVEVGELHVRYRVRLSIPVLQNALAAPVNNSVSWFQSTSTQTLTTAVATTLLLATAKTNGLAIVNTAGSFVPPLGNYHVTICGTWADNTNEQFTMFTDFKKNGVSQFTSITSPKGFLGATVAGVEVPFSTTVYVSANGTTDTFIVETTLTGAAGTLQTGANIVWLAV